MRDGDVGQHRVEQAAWSAVVAHLKPNQVLAHHGYSGADASFTLYNDDGVTYGYGTGAREIKTLRWDDKRGVLLQGGAKDVVEVVGKATKR